SLRAATTTPASLASMPPSIDNAGVDGRSSSAALRPFTRRTISPTPIAVSINLSHGTAMYRLSSRAQPGAAECTLGGAQRASGRFDRHEFQARILREHDPRRLHHTGSIDVLDGNRLAGLVPR